MRGMLILRRVSAAAAILSISYAGGAFRPLSCKLGASFDAVAIVVRQQTREPELGWPVGGNISNNNNIFISCANWTAEGGKGLGSGNACLFNWNWRLLRLVSSRQNLFMNNLTEREICEKEREGERGRQREWQRMKLLRLQRHFVACRNNSAAIEIN